jgi:N6-adenosine-specific RNA methylase IME4
MQKFQIVYADPPWQYADAGCNGAAENHYRTLSINDLKKLPVDKITDRDAVLFLWATMPLLPKAIDLMESWGFEYKSNAFHWVKTYPIKPGDTCATCKGDVARPVFGLGRWLRGNVEPCLLGVKGKPRRIAANVFSLMQETVLEYERLKHSAKPPIARERIVQLMGDLPRIELFARQTHDGWTTLGNEIDGRDIRESLAEFTGEPTSAAA